MTLTHFGTVTLFGGGGFIGTHFAAHLLKHGLADLVVLADSKPANIEAWPKDLRSEFTNGRVRSVVLDVREAITHPDLPKQAGLIGNFAAVHREPGHEPYEYFKTNLLGAENVCLWAESINCDRIVFTSSIAAYGTIEDRTGGEQKSENSLPTPSTPYGISKLVAEKIHIAWQKTSANHRLLIVRPGVIFGGGEQGNITRMVRAVIERYFFYTGNQNTRKAGGYVKELSNSMAWMLNRQDESGQPIVLFNFTMDPAPTVKEYGDAILKTVGIQRWIPSAPYHLILATSYFVYGFSKLTGKRLPIDPVRVRKLLRSNNIAPEVLRNLGYQYQFTLEQALADWRAEYPQDWK